MQPPYLRLVLRRDEVSIEALLRGELGWVAAREYVELIELNDALAVRAFDHFARVQVLVLCENRKAVLWRVLVSSFLIAL